MTPFGAESLPSQSHPVCSIAAFSQDEKVCKIRLEGGSLGTGIQVLGQ